MNWINRVHTWREQHLSERNFVSLLALIVGVTAGLAAVLLKFLIGFIGHLVESTVNATEGNWQYLVFPTIGILLSALYVRYVVRDNISHGVKVAGLTAGKFKSNGIKNGIIITHINQQPVDSQDDVEQIYNQIMRSQDEDKVMVITGLTQTGKKVYYAVDLSDVED